MKTYLVSLLLLSSISLLNAQLIRVPADQATIQAAIEEASEGDTILVDEGLYYENINFLGKAITVASHFLLDADTSHISKTIINGSQATHPDSASVVLMISGEDTTSVLTGFTITGGKGTFINKIHTIFEADYYGGGGILVYNSGAKITNNIIEENHISDPGNQVRGTLGCGILAAVNHNHNAIIRNNTIRYNSGTDNGAWGGGLSLHGGRFLVENNTISHNTLKTTTIYAVGAGIMWEYESQPGSIDETVIRNNLISGNKALSTSGGGCGGGICFNMRSGSGVSQLYNNVITGNIVEGIGGALYGWSSSASIYNNTLIDNEASMGGNYIAMEGNVSFLLFNNIFWNYLDNEKADYYFLGGGNSIRAQNNILNTPFSQNHPVEAENNYYEEPIFTGNTFELAENSPGIGWGIDALLVNSSLVNAPPYDMNSDPRPNPVDEYVDMGAFESPYLQTPLGTENIRKSGLIIYPNPAIDLLTFQTSKTGRYFIEITSLNGQQIFSAEMEGTSNHINLSDFAEGIYIMTIRSKEFVETRKIMKLR